MNFKPNMLFLNRSFDKKRLKALLLWFRLNLSENAALKAVEILQGLGFRSATQGAISLGLDDLKTPTSKGGRVFQAQVEVALAHHEHHRGNRTPVELFQHLVDTWHRTSQDLTTEVVQLFHSTERVNPVYMMAFSGARGNISQVRQLVGMRGLMADPRGQIVGFPILSNFREGLTITEYFVSCYGARKGVVDTAIRTADAGYLTRRLADVSHHVVVRTTNCGTHESILLRDIKEGQKTILSLANRLVGRVLAEHVFLPASPTSTSSVSHDLPPSPSVISHNYASAKTKTIIYRNSEITSPLASELATHYLEISVRSPLSCSLPWGVCQLCYGWGLSEGRRVTLGEAVGIIAAQSIGEPGTQLTLRTFHTGGVFSGELLNEIRAPYNGNVIFPTPLQGLLLRTPHGQIAFLTKVSGKMNISETEMHFESKRENLETSLLLQQSKGDSPFSKLNKTTDPSAMYKSESSNSGQSTEEFTNHRGQDSFLQQHKKILEEEPQQSATQLRKPVVIKAQRGTEFLEEGLFEKKQIDTINDTQNKLLFPKQDSEFIIQPSTVIFVKQKEHVVNNQLLAEFSSSTLQSVNDQIEITQQVLSDTAGQIWFKELEYGNRKGPGSGSLGTYFSSQKLGGIWVLAGKPMIDINSNFASSPPSFIPKGFSNEYKVKSFLSFDPRRESENEKLIPFKDRQTGIGDCTKLSFAKSLKSFIPLVTIVRGKQKLRIENTLSSNSIKKSINNSPSPSINAFINTSILLHKNKISFSNNCDKFLVFNNFVLSNLNKYPKTNKSLLKIKNLFKYHTYGIQNRLKRSINTRYSKTCTTSILNLQNNYDYSLKSYGLLGENVLKYDYIVGYSQAANCQTPSIYFSRKATFQNNSKSLLFKYRQNNKFIIHAKHEKDLGSQTIDKSIKRHYSQIAIDFVGVKAQYSAVTLPLKGLLQQAQYLPHTQRAFTPTGSVAGGTQNKALLGTTNGRDLLTSVNRRFAFVKRSRPFVRFVQQALWGRQSKEGLLLQYVQSKRGVCIAGDQEQRAFPPTGSVAEKQRGTRITHEKFFERIENKIKKSTLVFQELRSYENKFTLGKTRELSKKLDMLPLLSEGDLVTFVTNSDYNHTQYKPNAVQLLFHSKAAEIKANYIQNKEELLLQSARSKAGACCTNPFRGKVTAEKQKSQGKDNFLLQQNSTTQLREPQLRKPLCLLHNEYAKGLQSYALQGVKALYSCADPTRNSQGIVLTSMQRVCRARGMGSLLRQQEKPISTKVKAFLSMRGKNKKPMGIACKDMTKSSFAIKNVISLPPIPVLPPLAPYFNKTSFSFSTPLSSFNISSDCDIPSFFARYYFTSVITPKQRKPFNKAFAWRGLLRFAPKSYLLTQKSNVEKSINNKSIHYVNRSYLSTVLRNKEITRIHPCDSRRDITCKAMDNLSPSLISPPASARELPLAIAREFPITSNPINCFVSQGNKSSYFVTEKRRLQGTWIQKKRAYLTYLNQVSSISFTQQFTKGSKGYKAEAFTNFISRTNIQLSTFGIPSKNFTSEYLTAKIYKPLNNISKAPAVTSATQALLVQQEGKDNGTTIKNDRFFLGENKRSPLYPGQLVTYGDNIASNIVSTESGQVLYIDSQKTTLRKAQTVLIYSRAIIAVLSGDWIKKGTPLMSLSYQKLVTGDIVQGLPKIEQFFEAPVLRDGTFWNDSLQAKLNQFFQEEREKLPLAEAVRKGFSEIQRVLVEGVLRVYISQGVLIADKHLEVIVRQMTCKGRILYSGDTGFLRNELVSLDKIENVNQVTYGQKALYHPQVRGITDASLESESFLSAASFQETTRVLSRDAIIGKTDLMRGLKERVIVGELIQAGTGLANNSVYNLLAHSVT